MVITEHVSYTSDAVTRHLTEHLEGMTNFGSQSEGEDVAMRMAVCGRSRGTESQMCCAQEAERER